MNFGSPFFGLHGFVFEIKLCFLLLKFAGKEKIV